MSSRLVLLVLALALTAPHAEALSIGASQINNSFFSNTLTTRAMTTQASGSTCGVAVFGPQVANILSVTDSKANTYPSTPNLTVLYNFGSNAGSIWISPNCVGGSGHTFTVTMTAGAYVPLTLIAFEVESTGLYAVIDQTDTNPNLANVRTATTTSITPTTNGEVVLSFLAGGNFPATATTITDATGFNNILQSFSGDMSNTSMGVMGGMVQTTAAPITETFTIGSGINAGTAIISFKPN